MILTIKGHNTVFHAIADEGRHTPVKTRDFAVIFTLTIMRWFATTRMMNNLGAVFLANRHEAASQLPENERLYRHFHANP